MSGSPETISGSSKTKNPLPQIVETAHQTGEVVAHNIIAAIDGGTPKAFKSNYHGFMVSIGGKYGVADVGIFKLSGFPAMAMKHMINLYYLFTIAGVNQCWEYFKHEFLDIKDRRSIIGGFAEHKVRGYWPVLLRFWLGFSWVMEAVNKIGEGWLNFSLGSKSGWMFSKGIVQAGTDTACAAATATQWTTDSVDAASQATAQVADAATQAAGTATTSRNAMDYCHCRRDSANCNPMDDRLPLTQHRRPTEQVADAATRGRYARSRLSREGARSVL